MSLLEVIEDINDSLNTIYSLVYEIREGAQRLASEIEKGIPVEKEKINVIRKTVEDTGKAIDLVFKQATDIKLTPILVVASNQDRRLSSIEALLNSIQRSLERRELDVARKKLETIAVIAGDMMKELTASIDATASLIEALRETWKKIASGV